MKSAYYLFLSAFAFHVSATPVPRIFEADVSDPGTYQTSAYHGESLDIEAHLVVSHTPFHVPSSATATMLVSTNGVDWWDYPASISTGGVIRAAWTSNMDCGADVYRIFFGVSVDTNKTYSANMLLRLLASPGFIPNALPLPVQVLDFSKISWTNEPWSAFTGLTTNDVEAIARGVVSDDETVVRYEVGGGVNAAHMNVSGDITVGGNATMGGVIHAQTEVTVSGNEGNPYFALDDGGYVPALTLFKDYLLRFDNSDPESPAGPYEVYFPDKSGTMTLDADLAPYATRSWTLSTYGDTNAWMAIDGNLLGIYTCTNAAAGTNTLWESSSAMGGQLAGVALRATNNTTRITALERRPDLTSWGDYAPDGTPNPDAEAMVYLNKALTLMGSGFSWATSGAYACLCQSGSVAFHAETNGELRIGLDVVSNYFGMVQGGSVTVGCMTHGIRVEGSGDNKVVYLLYAYAGGEFPVIWGMTSLVGDKTELSPVWTDYGDGTAEAAVPGKPFYFFTATSSKSMEARFESKAPAAFPGGIYGSFMSPPVKYDSVITVQAGGHTYRIPAELVQ